MSVIRVIDFESTGMSPVDAGLCEIGYCDLRSTAADLLGAPSNWEVAGGHARLCNPGVPITPETEAIHHIGNDDVAEQPDWKPLLAALLRSAEKDDVIAYAAYGAEMEQMWMHPDWMGSEPPPMLDVYKVGLRVWGEQPPHHSNRALQYWRRPKGLRKADALPNHRAYQDALVTAYLLRDLLNDEGATIGQMVEWTKQPALTVKCYLAQYRNEGKGTPWSEVTTDYLDWIVNRAGFHDKPDIRFTAAYHLEQRMLDQREEHERQDLEEQLYANGLAADAADPNQMDLTL